MIVPAKKISVRSLSISMAKIQLQLLLPVYTKAQNQPKVVSYLRSSLVMGTALHIVQAFKHQEYIRAF